MMLLFNDNNLIKKIFTVNQFNQDEWVIKQAALIPPGQRVIDAGAGTGRYRRYFGHCEYITLDFGKVPDLIDNETYTQLDIVADIANIPVSDESFDVVLCTEVIEHVLEPIKVIEEFARILKPGGKLILTAPLRSRLHQEPYHYYGGFTPYFYYKVLANNNLKMQSISASQGYFISFAKEAIFYSCLINRAKTTNNIKLIIGHSIWILTLPFLRLILPILGEILDRLVPYSGGPSGYFVTAIKNPA